MSAKTLAIWKVLIASCLWGFSGIAAQLVFAQGFEPGWLVTVRMLVAGGVLTVLGLARGNSAAIFRHPKDAVKLLVFAILGMAAVQYTFFAAIKYGNAATATFLQYLSPVMVAAYQTIREPWLLNRKLVLSIAAALTGVFMLVTGGSFSTLQVSGDCVTWGLLSAVALSFYVLYPGALLKRYGT
ncbi:MAG TPA: DMT family transporter, partial [Chroococcales cyanobacterium]